MSRYIFVRNVECQERWCVFFQSRAWAAVRMALIQRGPASATPCASTTKAAAPTTRLYAPWWVSQRTKPKLIACLMLGLSLSKYTFSPNPFSSLHLQARGDTFVFPEDDYDDEPLEGASPSLEPTDSRRLRPSRKPATDFGRSPNRRPESSLDMSRPSRPLSPTLASTAASQVDPAADDVSTRAPEVDATPDATTTVAVATGTTEAPDPDAVVCSGKPFDAFMQIKNGSIFAFRGE